MNGNIALSMEIGSAYALQVCLLQIPALVLYSAFQTDFANSAERLSHTFSKSRVLAGVRGEGHLLTMTAALIFPQWDMVTVILCVFLLSYMYGEGKSNYFKGSILILSYFVVIVGFYFSSFNDFDRMGVDPTDTLAVGALLDNQFQSASFKTRGRGKQGAAF